MIAKNELDLLILKAKFSRPDDALIEQFVDMSMQMLARELQYSLDANHNGITAYLFYPHRVLPGINYTQNTCRWLLEGLQLHLEKFGIKSNLMIDPEAGQLYYLMVTGKALIDSVENFEAKKNLL